MCDYMEVGLEGGVEGMGVLGTGTREMESISRIT